MLQSLENDLEVLNLQTGDAEESIAQLNAKLKELDSKTTAAKELLAEAEATLAMPVEFGKPGCSPGDHARAENDKGTATEVLSKMASERAVFETKLAAHKNRLAQLEQRRKEFPMAELERQRRLQRLRKQVR